MASSTTGTSGAHHTSAPAIHADDRCWRTPGTPPSALSAQSSCTHHSTCITPHIRHQCVLHIIILCPGSQQGHKAPRATHTQSDIIHRWLVLGGRRVLRTSPAHLSRAMLTVGVNQNAVAGDQRAALLHAHVLSPGHRQHLRSVGSNLHP